MQEVAELYGLPHAGLVEKDYLVVKALKALSTLNDEDVSLAFGGGTALSKARDIIQRMSEDIDLKIVSKHDLSSGERKAFRQKITNLLLAAGFQFDPDDQAQLRVMDGGRSFFYLLPYDAKAPLVPGLRASLVRVEISSWPPFLPGDDLAIQSYVSKALGEGPEVPRMRCANIIETAAEKFVALTRRIGTERATGEKQDESVIRHIYDLHQLVPLIDVNDVAPLARDIMEIDKKRARGFDAYQENPVLATEQTLVDLVSDPQYAKTFDDFQNNMVYGAKKTLGDCMPALYSILDAIKR